MNYDSRFRLMYALLVLMLMCGLTVAAVTIAYKGKIVYKYGGACPVITETTAPNVVDRCVAGKLADKGKFPASELGLPQDGYCEDHSNGVSWRIIKCMGTQPESQP
jgi:hypothetical protein